MLLDYICKNCQLEFKSNKGDKNRTPLFCSRKCSATFNGKLKEVKYKMSIAKRGKTPWNFGVEMWKDKEHPRGTLGMKFPDRSGENSHLWRGGVSTENELARKSPEYKKWRKLVFERDNYTCVNCNKKGLKIQADHIKPFSLYKKLRYELSNGRTLCVECHKKTDTYGSKIFKYGVQKNN